MPPKKRQANEPSMADVMAVLQNLSDQLVKSNARVNSLEAQLQTVQAPPAPPPQDQPVVFQAEIDANQRYYVRIKPYNIHLGHVRRRQFFDELGQVLEGGTGMPGDIPIWIPVSPDQAQALTKYRQRDNDPNSPQVLDIVTEAERKLIDGQEQMHRMATLGVGGLPPSEVLGRMQHASKAVVRPHADTPAPAPPPRERPSLIPGAERFSARPQPARAAVEQLRPTAPAGVNMPGRAAALADAPPKPEEAHDFNTEGLDDDLIQGIANAQKMASTPVPAGESTQVTGSVRPKR